MKNDSKTAKRLRGNIVIVIVLALCLAITTFALIYEGVSVDDNLFHTGSVKINLNDGKPVIRENEFLFEPGMTVKKDFFIENESTWDVYYKIYMDDVTGGLAKVLDVTIKDGDKTLYHGTPAELNRKQVSTADEILKVNQKKTLTVYFHFPENAGNDAKSLDLTFTMCAEATQTKNNPNREFD